MNTNTTSIRFDGLYESSGSWLKFFPNRQVATVSTLAGHASVIDRWLQLENKTNNAWGRWDQKGDRVKLYTNCPFNKTKTVYLGKIKDDELELDWDELGTSYKGRSTYEFARVAPVEEMDLTGYRDMLRNLKAKHRAPEVVASPRLFLRRGEQLEGALTYGDMVGCSVEELADELYVQLGLEEKLHEEPFRHPQLAKFRQSGGFSRIPAIKPQVRREESHDYSYDPGFFFVKASEDRFLAATVFFRSFAPPIQYRG